MESKKVVDKCIKSIFLSKFSSFETTKKKILKNEFLINKNRHIVVLHFK